MHVVSKKRLKEYWEKCPETERALRAWHKEAEHARWKTPAELKAKYGSASIIDSKRVVFNICGNNHRLLVWVDYAKGRIFTRWLGTHPEYDAQNMGIL